MTDSLPVIVSGTDRVIALIIDPLARFAGFLVGSVIVA